jgi:hypothetical protein
VFVVVAVGMEELLVLEVTMVIQEVVITMEQVLEVMAVMHLHN